MRGTFQMFDIALQGDGIVVNMRPLPAGEYHARIPVSGAADVRYRAEVDVRNVVSAQASGEVPLSVQPANFALQLAQGTVIRVDPPWVCAQTPC
jgi:hypothetical protein